MRVLSKLYNSLDYIDSGADTPTNDKALCSVILTASTKATCAFVFLHRLLILFSIIEFMECRC